LLVRRQGGIDKETEGKGKDKDKDKDKVVAVFKYWGVEVYTWR
jgi:hypothetical protein